MTAAFLYDAALTHHILREDHILRPVRLRYTYELLEAYGAFQGDGALRLAPQVAAEADLLLFHTRDYVRAVQAFSRGERLHEQSRYNFSDQGDNPIAEGMYKAAALAVGASLVAAEALSADHRDSVVSATIAREELGTTGIGNGVAIPHAKHPAVDRVVATVGVGDAGIEFGSLDGRPTRVFFLLVSPPDAPQDHLQALETVSRHLQEDSFRQFLSQAQTPEAIRDVLSEADASTAA